MVSHVARLLSWWTLNGPEVRNAFVWQGHEARRYLAEWARGAQVAKSGGKIEMGPTKLCNVTSDGRVAQEIGHEWPPREQWTPSPYDLVTLYIHGPGASLLLQEGLAFHGAVTFTGRLSVQGVAGLEGRCVYVWGACTVASGAELRVENCSSGGLRVGRALQVDGALEVHQSHSAGFGGGVYVERTSAHRVEPWRRA